MCNKQEGKEIPISGTSMDYVAFGRGKKALVILPGLGDGLRTVKGSQFILSAVYRIFAKEFRVYLISRKNKLEAEYSTRDMAKDLVTAFDSLAISKASVLGISQGGMIAQYLAIDYPQRVEKLLLAVSIARANKTLQSVLESWIAFAEKADYRSLIIDSAEKSYSEARLKKYRSLYPFISCVAKVKSFERFLIQAQACLQHDAYSELARISCPTLVVGGSEDKIVGPSASPELAQAVLGSRLFIYQGLGHGLYDEAKDFNKRALEFFSEEIRT